jgi:LPXTG-motif cell wall-anchored protein
MFVDGTSPIQKIIAWIALLALFAPLGLGLYGLMTKNEPFLLLGLVCFGVVLAVLMVYVKWRAKHDPAVAARVEKAKARQRERSRKDAGLQVASVVIALMVFAFALAVRRFVPGFSALPKSDQHLYLMAVGIPVALLLTLGWLRLRRKKSAP